MQTVNLGLPGGLPPTGYKFLIALSAVKFLDFIFLESYMFFL
jgi:hypothetical protein